MKRRVTIPFPEGLHGDFSCACDMPAGSAAPAASLYALPELRCAEAARVFRESLARLGASACCDEPAARDTAPDRIAA